MNQIPFPFFPAAKPPFTGTGLSVVFYLQSQRLPYGRGGGKQEEACPNLSQRSFRSVLTTVFSYKKIVFSSSTNIINPIAQEQVIKAHYIGNMDPMLEISGPNFH